jgi:hypothetical protein
MIRIITILSFCLITTAMLAQTEPCDCEWHFDEPYVCAQDSTGTIFPVPNQCFADCLGLTVVDSTECDLDPYDWETDWDNDWDWDSDSDCDCDESAYEGAGICIEISESYGGEMFTYQAWAPSECFADCWGYENYVVVECDTTGYDWDNDWDWDSDWDLDSDCDCEYSDTDEFVCILTDVTTGEICPFPNMCFAECAGYTVDDVVDCVLPELECLDCLDEELNPVCVQDSLGNMFQVPNACFANCLNLTVIDDFNCGELEDGDDIVIGTQSDADLPQRESDDRGNISMRVFPNPATDNIVLEFELENQESLTTTITDAQGKVINQYKQDFLKGLNSNRVDVSELIPGMYMISMKISDNIVTQRFIKN